jgi:hypothetical protein
LGKIVVARAGSGTDIIDKLHGTGAAEKFTCSTALQTGTKQLTG